MFTRLREVLRCAEAKSLVRSVRGRGVGRLVLILLTAVLLVLGAQAAAANWQTIRATPANASEQHATQAAEPEEHSLLPKAVEIARVFGLPVTNSMFVSWVVALGLIVFARIATRRMNEIPGGAQTFLSGSSRASTDSSKDSSANTSSSERSGTSRPSSSSYSRPTGSASSPESGR